MKSIPVWSLRVAWAVLPFTLGPAVGQALATHSRPVQVAGTVGVWVMWAVVLLATLVPTTVSLTVLRTFAPGAVAVAVVAWANGASSAAGATGLALAAVVMAVAFSGDLGEAFVQGSAYGDERRLPLRPTGPLVLLVPLTWALFAAAWLIGPLALAARSWIPGGLLSVAAGAATLPLLKRYHRLSRRWLVVVPAGVVIHDHVVLSETAMFSVTDVGDAGLALVGSEAADLTGTALGPRVEIRLRDLQTIVLAAPPRGQTKALHVRSVLICPTRPGRALRALGDRGVRLG